MLPLPLLTHGTDQRRVEGGDQLVAVAAPSDKRSCTFYLPPPASASTDTAQDAPPPPAPPAAEADEIAPRDYKIPVHSQMAIPDNYERDDDDDDKDEKFEGGDIFVEEGVKPNTR